MLRWSSVNILNSILLLVHHSVAYFHFASLIPQVLTSPNHLLVFLVGFSGGGLHCFLGLTSMMYFLIESSACLPLCRNLENNDVFYHPKVRYGMITLHSPFKHRGIVITIDHKLTLPQRTINYVVRIPLILLRISWIIYLCMTSLINSSKFIKVFRHGSITGYHRCSSVLR